MTKTTHYTALKVGNIDIDAEKVYNFCGVNPGFFDQTTNGKLLIKLKGVKDVLLEGNELPVIRVLRTDTLLVAEGDHIVKVFGKLMVVSSDDMENKL